MESQKDKKVETAQIQKNMKVKQTLNNSFPVKLSFCLRSIRGVDVLSQKKCGYYLKVYLKNSKAQNFFKIDREYNLIGETQKIYNIANPNYLNKIQAKLQFYHIQTLKIELCKTLEDEVLATHYLQIDKILGSRCQTVIEKMLTKDKEYRARICVRIESDDSSQYSLQMNWRGGKIANVDSIFDFWNKSDPYLKFFKIKKENSYEEVARTQVIANNLEPNWQPITISCQLLGVDVFNPKSSFKYKIECWDYEVKQDQHELIGYTFVSIEKITKLEGIKQFKLINSQIKKPGKLFLDELKLIQPKQSFLNFIRSDLKIDMMTITDFSNHSKIVMREQMNDMICFKTFKLFWDKFSPYSHQNVVESYGIRARKQDPQQYFFALNNNMKNPKMSQQQFINTYFQFLSHLEVQVTKLNLSDILRKIRVIIQRQLKEDIEHNKSGYRYKVVPILLNSYKILDSKQYKQLIDELIKFDQLNASLILIDLGHNDTLNRLQQQYVETKAKFSQKSISNSIRHAQFYQLDDYKGSIQTLFMLAISEFPDTVVQYMKSRKKKVNVHPQIQIENILPVLNPRKDNKVQLIFACRDLANVRPNQGLYLKLYLKKKLFGNMEYISRTEIIEKTYSPKWNTKIEVVYIFQLKQSMRIELYHASDEEEKNPVAVLNTTLGLIIEADYQTLKMNLVDSYNQKCGKIIMRVEKKQLSDYNLMMNWRGGKLANVDSMFDFWDKSDPYLRFLRSKGSNTFVQVARTQALMNNLEPNWKPITIPLKKLGLDIKNPMSGFKLECWDHQEDDEHHEIIGQIFITLNDIKHKKCPIQFPLISGQKKRQGSLFIDDIEFLQPPRTFLNLIRCGLKFNFNVAIDFTKSNGPVESQLSLHHISDKKTIYENIVFSVQDVLKNFIKDGMISAYGFGCNPKMPQEKQRSIDQIKDCFAFNGNLKDPRINGVQKFMSLYQQIAQKAQFSGPTVLTPILNQVLEFMQTQSILSTQSKFKKEYEYNILMYIVDNINNDISKFIETISKNCDKNLSIVIIGLSGRGEDFSKLDKLNRDNIFMSRDQELSSRDVIQFVDYSIVDITEGKEKLLVYQILKKISWQIIDYFKKNNIPVEPISQPPLEQFFQDSQSDQEISKSRINMSHLSYSN